MLYASARNDKSPYMREEYRAHPISLSVSAGELHVWRHLTVAEARKLADVISDACDRAEANEKLHDREDRIRAALLTAESTPTLDAAGEKEAA